MYKSFGQFKEQRQIEEFDAQFTQLCETIVFSGMDFDDYWTNIGLPALLQSEVCESVEDLLNALYGPTILEQDDPFAYMAQQSAADRLQRVRDAGKPGLLRRGASWLAGLPGRAAGAIGSAASGMKQALGGGQAPYAQSQAGMVPGALQWAQDQGLESPTPPAAPAASGPFGVNIPKPKQVGGGVAPAAAGASPAGAGAPQDPKMQKAIDRLQKQADQATDRIKKRFQVAMKDFLKAMKDDASSTGNMHTMYIAQQFHQKIMQAAQPVLDTFKLKARAGEASYQGDWDAMMQARQATRTKALQGQKDALMDKHTTPRNTTTAGGAQPVPTAAPGVANPQ